MPDNNLKLNLIDNITVPLLRINSTIKNTTNLINNLADATKNIKLNTNNITYLNKEINQLGKNIVTLNQNIKPSKPLFSDFFGGLADLTSVITSIHPDYTNLIELFGGLKKVSANLGKGIKDLVITEFHNLRIGLLMTKEKLIEFMQTSTLAGKVGLTVLKEKIISAYLALKVFTKNTVSSGVEVGKMGLRMLKTGLQSIGRFIAMIYSAVTAQWAFNTAISANPLGALLLGIIAVVGAIILIINHWDLIKTKIGEFIGWIIENNPFGFLINVMDNIFPGFKEALSGLFDWVTNTFTKIADFIKDIWNSIKGWFGFGDGEEAKLTYTTDSNGNIMGDTTDTNGVPLELNNDKPTGANLEQGLLFSNTQPNASKSVKDYTATSPEAISRPINNTSGSSSTVNNNSKNISVRIESLVKNLNLNVTNLQEGSAKIRNEVNRALIAAIRDTEIAVG